MLVGLKKNLHEYKEIFKNQVNINVQCKKCTITKQACFNEEKWQ